MWSSLLAVLLFALSGCTLFSYDLTVPPVTPPTGQVHVGSDCAPVIFGLGVGHLRVADAMQNGGITQLSKVTLDQNYVLLFGLHCLTVEGEGPGPAPRVKAPPSRK